MDHAAARERIADLAIESRGLDDLDRSARPEDRDLRAHLAGCAACRDELEAWSRLQGGLSLALPADGSLDSRSPAIQPVAPPRELRGRILDDIRRGASAGIVDPVRAPAPEVVAPRLPPWRSLAWAAAAAALVVAVVSGGIAWDQSRRLDAARAESAALRGVVDAVERVQAAPGHRVSTLVAPDGTAGGSVSWSDHDLVVITTGIAAPAPGQVYRCWLNDGRKSWAIGHMEFAAGTGYWIGSLDEWASWDLGPAPMLRVSLEATAADPRVRSGPIVLEAAL